MNDVMEMEGPFISGTFADAAQLTAARRYNFFILIFLKKIMNRKIYSISEFR
jgi:hypothetical protein